MLIYQNPFPGYTTEQDFILRLLLSAEGFGARELRFLRDGQEMAMDYLIAGEWKSMKAPPSKLWPCMIDGITSLLEFPNSLPEQSAGMIQSNVLKSIWLFYSVDVNRQLRFVKNEIGGRKRDL